MLDKYGAGQDPYCYPNTKVLINKFGIKDEKILQEAEREITTVALKDIFFSSPPYNLNYLKNIHDTLFSHIYDWAGKIRTVDIAKQETLFCTCSRIEPEANKIFLSLKKKDYFLNNTNEIFIKNIAELYADLNMIHPFREGNGRVQRLLFEHIALNCGYIIDWGTVSTETWITANIHGVNCDFKPLEKIFQLALSKFNTTTL